MCVETLTGVLFRSSDLLGKPFRAAYFPFETLSGSSLLLLSYLLFVSFHSEPILLLLQIAVRSIIIITDRSPDHYYCYYYRSPRCSHEGRRDPCRGEENHLQASGLHALLREVVPRGQPHLLCRRRNHFGRQHSNQYAPLGRAAVHVRVR